MKRNFLLRIATLMLAVMLLPQAAWALKGSGTSSDSYIVETAADLETIREKAATSEWANTMMYISLANDIVLPSSFQPLGTSGKPIYVYFRGNRHTISGLNLNYTTSYQGFFGAVKGTVENLKVTGKMTSTKSGLSYIGGVAGFVYPGAKFKNVASEVNITITGVAQAHVGGVIGHVEGNSAHTLTNLDGLQYSGVIDAGKTTDCVGGIVGFVHADSKAQITDCYSRGSIYSAGSSPTLGGILGYNNNENSVFQGVSGSFSHMGLHYAGNNTHVGGIVGRLRAQATYTINNYCFGDSCENKGYNTDGPSIPKSNKVITASECLSGMLAYTLYEEKLNNWTFWAQELGVDKFPYLVFDSSASHMRVYYVSAKKCTGESAGNRYSNSYSTIIVHNLEHVDAAEPLCYKYGNIEHYHCTDCNKLFSDSDATHELAWGDVFIDMLDCNFEPVWKWASDGKWAQYTMTCMNPGCDRKYNPETLYFDPDFPTYGDIVREAIAPTCAHRGMWKYTATAWFMMKKYQSSTTVINPEAKRLPHTFVDGECTVCHEGDYLTFISNGETTIGITNYNGNKPVIEYSIDGNETWTVWDYHPLTLAHGSEVKMRGVNATGFSNPKNVAFADDTPMSTFVTGGTGSISTKGRLMSLIDGHGTVTTIPSESCFRDLFKNCENLQTSPQLTATNLTKECYRGMFYNCPRIYLAPSLPATTLAERCYYAMFYNCQKLRHPPILPATKLANGCYEGLFRECIELQEAPELPATTLADYCYRQMFYNCKSIVKAPFLPAKTLKANSYYRMFDGCTKLNMVRARFTNWNGATDLWLRDVAPQGFLDVPEALDCSTIGVNTIPQGWAKLPHSDSYHPNPLTFVAQEDGSSVKFVAKGSFDVKDYKLQYSTDKKTWKDYDTGITINLAKAGDMVAFRTTLNYANSDNVNNRSYINYITTEMTGKIAAQGNIMSLAATTELVDSVPPYFFAKVFTNSTALTSVPELPATKLGEACYSLLFEGCTSLTQVPEDLLPANNIPSFAYERMFYGCNQLKTAPKLSATDMMALSYYMMFEGCSALNQIEVGFTEWKLQDIYNQTYGWMKLYPTSYWMRGVAPRGVFICPKELEIQYGQDFIPEGWRVVRTGEPIFDIGDVNGDGLVDIIDINILVSIMLGDASAADYNGRADINNDGSVDIIDINSIVASIL